MKKMFYIPIFLIVFLVSCAKDEVESLKESQRDPVENEVAFPSLVKMTRSAGDATLEQTANGDCIWQGDILLVPEQVALLEIGAKETRGAILNGSSYKWPNGIVYYTIAAGTDTATRTMISEAMYSISASTVIKFQQRTNQANYVEFFNGDGCWSYLGKIGGKQQLSIDKTWAVTGNVVHEICHALGMIHEHSRNDRDTYITVNYNNIIQSAKINYDKNTSSHITMSGLSGGVDFNSIMIYGSYSSSNAINSSTPVMTKRDGTTWTAQRNNLTLQDTGAIALIYGQKKTGGGGIFI